MDIYYTEPSRTVSGMALGRITRKPGDAAAAASGRIVGHSYGAYLIRGVNCRAVH